MQGTNLAVNVYGIPWVFGAKKGFPNFNAFSMESVFSIARKLMLTRPSTAVTFLSDPGAYTFAQQFTLGLTNYLQVQCWNSYRADYSNGQPVEICATDWSTVVLTNDEGMVYPASSFNANAITNSDWRGNGTGATPDPSFLIPLQAGNVFVPNLVYNFDPAQPFTPDPNAYFTNITVTPHWGLLVTNRLRVVMVERNPADNLFHVIDYVHLIGPDGGYDLSADIQRLYDKQPSDPQYNAYYDDQWDTNIINIGVPIAAGLANQFIVSAQLTPVILSPYWEQQDPVEVANQMAVFRGFLGLAQLPGASSQSYNLGKQSLWQQAPYTPIALVAYITKWANDPLVHYLASDLTDRTESTAPQKYTVSFTSNVLNNRYMPWGGNPMYYAPDGNVYNSALKDPLVSSSDGLEFSQRSAFERQLAWTSPSRHTVADDLSQAGGHSGVRRRIEHLDELDWRPGSCGRLGDVARAGLASRESFGVYVQHE